MKIHKSTLEPAFHLAFWVLLFSLSLSATGPMFSAENALGFTFLRVFTLIAIAYIHLWVIIPRFFRQAKFLQYAFAIIALLAVSVMVNAFFFDLWGPELIRDFPKRFNRPPGGSPFRFGGPFPQIFLTFATLLFTLFYALGREFQRKDQETSQIEKEKFTYELNFLRSQINPHFLFNALNNLHATVELNPHQASDYVLKLGEMLRYVLEDCKREKVRLSDEIIYIHNYLFFQRQKDSEFQNISFEVSGDNPDSFSMEPMLLIALVENAFIHSYVEDIQKQFVSIHIFLDRTEMRFSVRNNLPENSDSKRSDSHHIGLNNVKRRLELLYPDQYAFSYGEAGNEYKAEIILERDFL